MVNIKQWCEQILQSFNQNQNKKYLLIAGASNSGKTYRCDVLKDYLISHGKKCLLVSLDSYYKGISKTIVEKAFLKDQFSQIENQKENLIKLVRGATENSTFPTKFCEQNQVKLKKELNKTLPKETAERFFAAIKTEYENINFDEPFAIDFNMIVAQINSKTKALVLPTYSFKVNERLKEQEKIYKKDDYDVIIFEGIYALRSELLEHINKNLITTTAIQCDLKTMLVRKFNRDIKQGRSSLTPQQTFLSFFTQVMPSYFEYIRPTFQNADIILNSPLSYEEMIEKDQPTQIKLKYELKDRKNLSAATLKNCEKQTDYYLTDATNTKNVTFRIREINGKATKLIINYDCPGKKGYEVYELSNMLEEKYCNINYIKNLFNSVGFKTKYKIEKIRNQLEQNGCNFTVDFVKDLGNFIEFDQKDYNEISKLFPTKSPSDYSNLTYDEMLEQNKTTEIKMEL